ncbi:hypothetical protein N9948_01605 [bacterium]|nr:hypothetical protein [bacterium]
MLNETDMRIVKQDEKNYLLLEKKTYLLQEIEGEINEQSLLDAAEQLKGRHICTFDPYARRAIREYLDK